MLRHLALHLGFEVELSRLGWVLVESCATELVFHGDRCDDSISRVNRNEARRGVLDSKDCLQMLRDSNSPDRFRQGPTAVELKLLCLSQTIR